MSDFILHLFIASVKIENQTKVPPVVEKFKLIISYEDDLAEYGIYSKSSTGDLRVNFNQTIHIQVDQIKTGDYKHRLLFKLYGVTPNNDMPLIGTAILRTSATDAAASRSLLIHDTKDELVCRLFFTMFYNTSAIDISDETNLKDSNKSPDKNHKDSIKEYSFLLSRRVRRPDAAVPVTFDHIKASRLEEDAQWYLKEGLTVQNTKSSTIDHPKKIKPRSSTPSKAIVQKEAPKVRKTVMSVGYVHNAWPEVDNTIEKKLYQYKLADERKMKLLEELAQQLALKKQKKLEAKKQAKAQAKAQAKQNTEEEFNQRKLNFALKNREDELKKLQSKLTRMKLESALTSDQSNKKSLRKSSDLSFLKYYKEGRDVKLIELKETKRSQSAPASPRFSNSKSLSLSKSAAKPFPEKEKAPEKPRSASTTKSTIKEKKHTTAIKKTKAKKQTSEAIEAIEDSKPNGIIKVIVSKKKTHPLELSTAVLSTKGYLDDSKHCKSPQGYLDKSRDSDYFHSPQNLSKSMLVEDNSDDELHYNSHTNFDLTPSNKPSKKALDLETVLAQPLQDDIKIEFPDLDDKHHYEYAIKIAKNNTHENLHEKHIISNEKIRKQFEKNRNYTSKLHHQPVNDEHEEVPSQVVNQLYIPRKSEVTSENVKIYSTDGAKLPSFPQPTLDSNKGNELDLPESFLASTKPPSSPNKSETFLTELVDTSSPTVSTTKTLTNSAVKRIKNRIQENLEAEKVRIDKDLSKLQVVLYIYFFTNILVFNSFLFFLGKVYLFF